MGLGGRGSRVGSRWGVGGHAPLLLAALLLTLLSLVAFYNTRRNLAVNVGDLGDSALVSGFYADEPDLDYRYRWSKSESEVLFTAAGWAPLERVSVEAQGARIGEAASVPVTMSVSVNGQLMEPLVVTLTQELATYEFRPTANLRVGGPFTVSMQNSTFSPPGDGRELGVKVDRVVVSQSGDGLNLPPLWVVAWCLILIAGVCGLLSGVRIIPRAVGAVLTAFLLIVALAVDLTVVTAYLPPVAAVTGVGGLLLWQRKRVTHWPEWVDALGKTRIATWVMLGAMVLYAVLSLWTLVQVDWIGHADYAENAVIARNFVEGRGLTVDYVAQFYKDYPGISHPAETWPLLQPLMIAPFFALFGPETWAAKLPNLFVMLALTWAVFYVGSKLWEPRVGLLAGLFTLAHPYFFNSVLYPINDLAFTAIFFVLAWLVWSRRQTTDDGRQTTDDGRPETTDDGRRDDRRVRKLIDGRWGAVYGHWCIDGGLG